jgi:hypothetical protein
MFTVPFRTVAVAPSEMSIVLGVVVLSSAAAPGGLVLIGWTFAMPADVVGPPGVGAVAAAVGAGGVGPLMLEPLPAAFEPRFSE